MESNGEVINEPTKEVQKLSKKDLINYFLLFRFVGSIVLLGVIGGLAELFEWEGRLIVGILTIAMVNIPMQLYYLVVALLKYYEDKKKD